MAHALEASAASRRRSGPREQRFFESRIQIYFCGEKNIGRNPPQVKAPLSRCRWVYEETDGKKEEEKAAAGL